MFITDSVPYLEIIQICSKRGVWRNNRYRKKEMYTFDDIVMVNPTLRPEGTASCGSCGKSKLACLFNQVQRLWLHPDQMFSLLSALKKVVIRQFSSNWCGIFWYGVLRTLKWRN